MKRDLNLVRQLLLVIENAETTSLSQMHGLNPSDQQVQYHLRLLVDAGLVRGVGLTNEGSICVRLTWEGHEMLELARNEQLWERARRLVQDKMGGNPITAIRAVLTRWAVMSTSEEERWPVRLPHQQQQVYPPGNGYVSNGSINRLAPAAEPAAEAMRQEEVVGAFRDSGFQFNVWPGDVPEDLPLYLL